MIDVIAPIEFGSQLHVYSASRSYQSISSATLHFHSTRHLSIRTSVRVIAISAPEPETRLRIAACRNLPRLSTANAPQSADCCSALCGNMDASNVLDIRPITAADTIPVRHAVLWPNSPRDHVCLPEDDAGLHFGAFVAGQPEPIAVISLFSETIPAVDSTTSTDHTDMVLQNAPETIFRFRKFACDQRYQGRGIGSALLQHVLTHARAELGAHTVWCDARLSTAEWYQRRGLVPFGEPFYKSSVDYVRMKIEYN
ncbi:hypothetical protein EVG20_g5794 [Dentipellis fragilis]|uniref:N-acetyltransferase domain-containing protein n=1 Tax=Dentipellis fragilis TaxID=205917 RepID=A0A4Y9YUU6_9AGAM|nr:hypothetical protein EVG20_g5794 [Dentipellis fragilis]